MLSSFLSLIPKLKSELQIAVSRAAQTAVADMLIVTGIPATFTNEWSFHKWSVSPFLRLSRRSSWYDGVFFLFFFSAPASDTQLSCATSSRWEQSASLSALCFLRCVGWTRGRLTVCCCHWRGRDRTWCRQVPVGLTRPGLSRRHPDHRRTAGLMSKTSQIQAQGALCPLLQRLHHTWFV